MSAVVEFGFNAAPVFSGVDAMERKLRKMDDSVITAQTKLAAALKNPWVSAGVDQQKYFAQLLATERQTRQIAAAHAKLASYKGPQTAAPVVNPWVTAGAGQYVAQQDAARRAAEAAEAASRSRQVEAIWVATQEKRLGVALAAHAAQQRAAESAAAAQQRLAAINAASQSKAMAAAAAAASLVAAEQRSASLKTNNGRMHLALLEAQISGNKREVASIQNRITLMERMRQIQQDTNVSQREAYVLSQRSSGLARQMAARGRNMNLGMVSMQMQDVMVQAQMGTRWSTIIAQQGSQLASIFGPGGMIIGGLAAVGGLFYGVQQKGMEALQALKEEALGFDKSLRHLKVGGIMEMIDGMEKMQAAAKSMSADAATRTGTGMWEATARFFSPSRFENGKVINSYDERRDVAADLATKNEQGRKALMEQIVKTAEEELRIAQMRAAGRDAEADKLAREVAMRRELAKLDAAPAEIRSQLQDNVRAKAAAEQQAADVAAAKQKQEEAAKLAAAQKTLDDQKKDAALDQMTLAQRIAVMNVDAQKALAEENKLKAASKIDVLAIISAESRRVQIQSQINGLQKQYVADKQREAEATKRAAEQAATAAATQRGTVLNTALEYQMLQAKARGNKREMERIEYSQRVLERAARLEQQNGLDKKAALALAIKMTDLEDRANGKRTRIRGVQTVPGDPQDRYGLSGRAPGTSMSGRTGPLSRGGPLTRNGGLTGFWNRQLGNIGQLGNNPSGFMNQQTFSNSPSLAATHQANAAAQQAAGMGPVANNFLQSLLQQLPPALANAILGIP